MQFRLNRRADVPLRDQLFTQLVLAVASGELHPGDPLPSTRELARRYRIHQNTVSAAYTQLVRAGWAQSRRGSRVYISENTTGNGRPTVPSVDELIKDFVRKARTLEIPVSLLDQRWKAWLQTCAPPRFVVAEADPNLRQILVLEAAQALRTDVEECSSQDAPGLNLPGGAVVLAMPSKINQIRCCVAPEVECLALQIQSVQKLASMYALLPADWLVGVVSGWDGFLKIAREMLAACGCDPDAVMFRNSHQPDWEAGLNQAQVIICDSFVRQFVPAVRHVIEYKLLSEDCVAELKACQRFFGGAQPVTR